MNRRTWVVVLAFAALSADAVRASVTTNVVQAANAFLATLSPAEQAKSVFGFTSSQKTDGLTFRLEFLSATACDSAI
jgi:hypothetical protein